MATVLGEALSPTDAITYWKDKVLMSDSDAKSLMGGAKSRAFYVSGLAELDQINAVHKALLSALENGETLRDFKKNIANVIDKQGWHKHRIENIFQTNMQTAYSAGRYAQMQKVTQTRPYWQMASIMDKRTRPSHAVLHGIVYRFDHEFWSSHYPPNGFRCRCTVRTLSERQVGREKLQIQDKMPSSLKYVDPVTKMESFVHAPKPDKGFSGNVGKNWLGGLHATEIEHDSIKDKQKRTTCLQDKPTFNFASYKDRIITHGEPCLPPLINLSEKYRRKITKADYLPQGLKDEEYALAFMKEFGIKNIDESVFYKPQFLKEALLINQQLFLNKEKNVFKANKAGRGIYMKILASVIKEPYEVWHVPIEISGKNSSTLRFLRVFDSEEEIFGGFSVFNWIDNGRYWSGATVFRPKGKPHKTIEYLEAQRNGTLLFRESGGGVL